MLGHQYIAVALFVFVSAILLARHGTSDEALRGIGLLLVTLLPVLLYRWLARASRFGFWQYFASDFRAGPHPAPFAVLAWLVFAIALLALYFDWSLV